MRDVLDQLLSTGSNLYGTGATAQCAEAYRRAGEVARALGDREMEVHACFWEGCALHGGGALRNALAVMAPVLTSPDAAYGDSDVYRIATRYLRVLLELPIERGAVEKAIDEVEEQLIRAERPLWRSRVLVLRGRLALSTGQWRKGLALTLEGLEARNQDPFGLSRSSYYWVAVLLCIWLGELNQAARLLRRWRPIEPERPNQRIYRAWLHSCLLRRRGAAPDALAHAREAHVEALANGEYPERFTASVELTRVLLTLGNLEPARAQLSELLRFRSSEVSEHAYVIRMLIADYHLARARSLGGLQPLDLEFQHAYAKRRGASRNRDSAAHEALLRARRAYSLGAIRGESLDKLYGCELRGWQLSDRLAALERTGGEIG